MNSEKWSKVKEIFTSVADLPDDERRRALNESTDGDEELRRAVEKLIRSDAQSETRLDNFSVLKPGAGETRIGKYEILQRIGAGGMGAVYLARRADLPQKTVALKIIRHGAADSDVILRRFRREQEILSHLEHANIARLLDIGASADGAPYLVMEYVEGADLIAHCREKNLSLPEKLKLFRKVCDAVSYAHSQLVVHRDLKPSNILITRAGEPKLLDFGISKLLSDAANEDGGGTVTSLGMLTPNYASPEQFRGLAATTATDVYSLGVILYELLTGALPYNVTGKRLDQAARVVCEDKPQKPSEATTSGEFKTQNSRFKIRDSQRKKSTSENDSSNTSSDAQKPKTKNLRFLKGDLDNVVLKALRKEPERRYASVEKFSGDVSRYLDGLTVAARPDTFAYRAEKYVKRNRAGVAAASLIFLSMLVGVGATTYQSIRAERERQIAERRFNQVRGFANEVLFKHNDALAKLEGSTEVRAALVRDATEYLDSLAREQGNSPALSMELAQAYLRIGDLQGEAYRANLGDTEGAFSSYSKALDISENLSRETTNSSDAENLKSRALLQLGKLQIRRGRFADAADFLRRAEAIAARLAEDEPGQTEYKRTLARIYISLGDAASRDESAARDAQIETAGQYFERARAASDALLAAQGERESDDLRINAVAHQRLGNIYAQVSDAPETEIFQKAAAHLRAAAQAFGELAEREPQNVEYQRSYADHLLLQSFVKSRAENSIDAALADCRAATATLEGIAASDRTNKEAQFDTAMAYYQTSNVLEGAETNIPEAINLMLRAVEILERLNVENPNSDEFRTNLKFAYSRLSGMYKRSGGAAKSTLFLKKSQALN